MPKTRQAIIHELAEQLASMENENLAELLEFARWLNAEQQQAAMLAKMPPALSRQTTTECS